MIAEWHYLSKTFKPDVRVKLQAVELWLLNPAQTGDLLLLIKRAVIQVKGLNFVLHDLQWRLKFDSVRQQLQIKQQIKTLVLPQLLAQGQQARLTQAMTLIVSPVKDWTPDFTIEQMLQHISHLKIRDFVLSRQDKPLLTAYADIQQQPLITTIDLFMNAQQLTQILPAILLQQSVTLGYLQPHAHQYRAQLFIDHQQGSITPQSQNFHVID